MELTPSEAKEFDEIDSIAKILNDVAYNALGTQITRGKLAEMQAEAIISAGYIKKSEAIMAIDELIEYVDKTIHSPQEDVRFWTIKYLEKAKQIVGGGKQ